MSSGVKYFTGASNIVIAIQINKWFKNNNKEITSISVSEEKDRIMTIWASWKDKEV